MTHEAKELSSLSLKNKIQNEYKKKKKKKKQTFTQTPNAELKHL